jgi:class 3 adenylate cyclase
LRQLPLVDFGIGVSAGQVFAGNIGAEHRCEYTVIGDPVNEAARLADRAKTVAGRLLCSDTVLRLANDVERRRWIASGSEALRGRLAATQMFEPRDDG